MKWKDTPSMGTSGTFGGMNLPPTLFLDAVMLGASYSASSSSETTDFFFFRALF
jgi:hypothetical protein